jgi:hypothetical protein
MGYGGGTSNNLSANTNTQSNNGGCYACGQVCASVGRSRDACGAVSPPCHIIICFLPSPCSLATGPPTVLSLAAVSRLREQGG